MINIKETPYHFEITFPYNPKLVEEIKQIPGRRFLTEKKHWQVPRESQEQLLQWATRYTRNPLNQEPEQAIDYKIPELPELTIDVPLKMQLFPYQRKGVAYGITQKRLIVGDEPGLGKTGQAIAMAVATGAKTVLVICPSTLKENWKREFAKWSDRKQMILTDRVKKTWPSFIRVGMVDVIITNYESLKKYFVNEIVPHYDQDGNKKPLRLNHIKFNETTNLFDFVIIDEVHRCKDGKGQQTKFVMGICKGKEHVVALTGTPVVNAPKDLVSQLYIIGRLDEVFGGYKRFVDRYCSGPRGASNLKELNYQLRSNCFYRREKKEVLKDLPDKIRQIVKVDISTRPEYDKAAANLEAYLRENLKKTEGEITTSLRGEIMVQMMLLKQISAKGKLEGVTEFIEEVTDAGEKIVVFLHHKEIAYQLHSKFPGALLITGDNVGEDRQRAIDEFQNNPDKKIILCSIKAAGVGLTLTASSRVLFVEQPWHPADCDQCEDRCHRIGQKDSVQCTYVLGENTIDEYIYDIIQRKREISDEITGNESLIETSVLDQLITLINKP